RRRPLLRSQGRQRAAAPARSRTNQRPASRAGRLGGGRLRRQGTARVPPPAVTVRVTRRRRASGAHCAERRIPTTVRRITVAQTRLQRAHRYALRRRARPRQSHALTGRRQTIETLVTPGTRRYHSPPSRSGGLGPQVALARTRHPSVELRTAIQCLASLLR